MELIKGEEGNRRYAFVLPRFGEGLVGGAETLCGELARHLKNRGDEVEVFTTCARDNRSWANEYPVGKAYAFGLPVHRFPVDERDLERWIPIQISISEGMRVAVEDQLAWMQNSVVSSALLSHLEQVGNSYDALFFAPYLFGTTFWGAMINPERSIIIPCLHDEPYAYLEIIGSMFRQVRGCLFNAQAEGDLARSLYGALKGGEVGMGFSPPTEARLRALKPYFKDRFPYMVYAGRKETGKNAHLLIDYFINLKESGATDDRFKLVIAGGGSFEDLERPAALKRDDIIDLPQVSEDEKQRLIRHASFLCQPSVNESFSIVLMEAWLLETPVLVNGACAVTRDHVVSAGGGLYFSDTMDFSLVVSEMLRDEGLRRSMAMAGKSYVNSRYNWAEVLKRFDRVMGEIGREEISLRGHL